MSLDILSVIGSPVPALPACVESSFISTQDAAGISILTLSNSGQQNLLRKGFHRVSGKL